MYKFLNRAVTIKLSIYLNIAIKANYKTKYRYN